MKDTAEIARDLSRHQWEKLRLILSQMFPGLKFGGWAYGGQDVDLVYLLNVDTESRRLTKTILAQIEIAVDAINRTIRSYP